MSIQLSDFPLQQSQHLSSLSRADHSFISQIESRSHHGTSSEYTCDSSSTSSYGTNYGTSYGTISSTERHSVISMLSRDQSLSEIHVENSLQVISTPQRIVSAPLNCSPKTKKMLSQQSQPQSLTNLIQDIPEYPYDNEENEHREGEEYRGHPSLQRQNTGRSTKVVFAGMEDSISREQYQSVMVTKSRMPKQNAVEEGM